MKASELGPIICVPPNPAAMNSVRNRLERAMPIATRGQISSGFLIRFCLRDVDGGGEDVGGGRGSTAGEREGQ